VKGFSFALIALLLAACSTTHLPHGPRASASSPDLVQDEEKDSGPLTPPDLSGVEEPVPVRETKSRYGNPPSYTVLGETYQVLDSAEGFRQRGIASWYGNKFHGKRTSSGEPYDMYKMTAAHKTLPIPVHVRVSNLDNGKSIIVRVNDRGPFVKDRIIDLSYAAAHKLGMTGTGTARVEITALTEAPAAAGPGSVEASAPETLYVQVGAFGREESAEAMAAALSPMLGHPVRVQKTEAEGRELYRVRVGPFSQRVHAEKVRSYLSDKGYPGSTIVAP
jgi:rare lipoprotein A